VIPFEFRSELWCQKTRVPALSCGVICVIIRLAVLIQYRSVTDTHTHIHTHTQTDRHTTTAYTTLSMASRGKNHENGILPNNTSSICQRAFVTLLWFLQFLMLAVNTMDKLQFLPRDSYAKRAISRRRVCVCMCVCVSVTQRYCIKTAKRRITQITPHDSLLTLVFWCQSSLRNSNGITPSGGDKCRWRGLKFVTFDEKRAITRKRYKIDAWFLLKSNSKSYVLYQMVMSLMTLSDP